MSPYHFDEPELLCLESTLQVSASESTSLPMDRLKSIEARRIRRAFGTKYMHEISLVRRVIFCPTKGTNPSLFTVKG